MRRRRAGRARPSARLDSSSRPLNILSKKSLFGAFYRTVRAPAPLTRGDPDGRRRLGTQRRPRGRKRPHGILHPRPDPAPRALVAGDEPAGARAPGQPLRAGDLEMVGSAPLSDGVLRHHYRRRGRAPGFGARKPGHARRIPHHPQPLRGIPDHSARRGRPRSSPCRLGAALHHRGQGCLHRRFRRAHQDAARRFRHHPVLDLARPRQSQQRADGLARRTRHASRQPDGRGLPRRLSRQDPSGGAARRRGRCRVRL